MRRMIGSRVEGEEDVWEEGGMGGIIYDDD